MKNKLILMTVMMLFGTISLLVRNIALPSSILAMVRGFIGGGFLLIYLITSKKTIDWKSVISNIKLLILAGAAMGFNWILLFEAYKNTTVSIATLSYYLAPAIVVGLSPWLLKEKLSSRKVAAVTIAMVGLVLIVNPSGLIEGTYNHVRGITYGLMAALLYATVVLTNKFFKDLSGIEATMIQLIFAAVVLLPYIVMVEKPVINGIDLKSIVLTLIVSVFYTGTLYAVYFTVVKSIQGQTIAVLSYMDPITAVLISVVFLGERMTVVQLVGGVLILGATYMGEMKKKEAPIKRCQTILVLLDNTVQKLLE